MEGNGLGLETELRLGLPGSRIGGDVEKNERKRVFSLFHISKSGEGAVRKNQVVGWPPVRAYRQKNSVGGTEMYVKVSMDGAPFLRKMDLSMNKGYTDLVMALEQLFGCFGIGEVSEDDADNCVYMPIYEDKDGDWMLLGDVPWEMFTESCKRIRIMKKDAKCIGLQAKDLLKRSDSMN